jgi:aromatic ring-opening dioxygenase LigB subunit
MERSRENVWIRRPRSRLLHLATAITVQILLHRGDAEVVIAAVIPHGDFAYDPSLIDGKNGSVAVHDAAVVAGKRVAAARPDLIVLITPHGLALDNDFAVFTNSNGSGFALIGQDLHNTSFPSYKVPLSVALDPTEAAAIVAAAGGPARNTTGLLGWADSEPIPLRWGEVVPLSFLREVVAPTNGRPTATVVVVSVPLRRYKNDVAMIPELLALGRNLGHHFAASRRRVAVVVSADLAHTHLASGPYGFSNSAEPFDMACGRWAITLNGSALLVEAAALVDRALSCGFTGMVMLHGLLTSLQEVAEQVQFTPDLLANEHPTYYGMLVATFTAKA